MRACVGVQGGHLSHCTRHNQGTCLFAELNARCFTASHALNCCCCCCCSLTDIEDICCALSRRLHWRKLANTTLTDMKPSLFSPRSETRSCCTLSKYCSGLDTQCSKTMQVSVCAVHATHTHTYIAPDPWQQRLHSCQLPFPLCLPALC